VQSRGEVSMSSLAYSPPGGGSCRRAGGTSTGSTTQHQHPTGDAEMIAFQGHFFIRAERG
jgi:hypothetical protein